VWQELFHNSGLNVDKGFVTSPWEEKKNTKKERNKQEVKKYKKEENHKWPKTME